MNETIQKPQNILEIFATAQSHLKWPKLTIPLPDGTKLQFSLIHKTHFNSDGVLWISNGLGKNNGGIIYGMETKNQTIRKGPNFRPEFLDIIVDICKDPVRYASMKGLQYSNCCFCGLELTNKNSLIAGYGPICAEKWGLPWDGLAEEKETGDL